MNIASEMRRYLRMLITWSWLLVLGALLAGGVNYYLTATAQPVYQAQTILMIGEFIRQPNPDQLEAGVTDRLTGYYLELLHRQPVLDGVKQELHLTTPNDILATAITAQVLPSTSFIQIVATDNNPNQVVRLANAFAHQLILQSPTAPENQRKQQLDFIQTQLDDLQKRITQGKTDLSTLTDSLNVATTAAEIADLRARIKALQSQIDGWQTNFTALLQQTSSSAPNSIDVLETANQARRVQSISPVISAGIAAAIGAALALSFAILLEYLDDRLKSSEDIKARLHLEVVGHVARRKRNKGKAGDDAESDRLDPRAAEAFELLCSNIAFSDVYKSHPSSLLITAPDSIKEQAYVAMNISIGMVSLKQSVLLVDANTRHPELHDLMGLENKSGFFEVFYGTGYLDIEDKVQETAVPNLYLMTAGHSALDSLKLVVLRPGTQQIYDLPSHLLPGEFVVFNCGSVLNDRTARLLVTHITSTIILCELNRTRGKELKAVIEVIERLKGRVVGVVTIVGPRRFPFALFKRARSPKPAKTKRSEPADSVAVGVE